MFHVGQWGRLAEQTNTPAFRHIHTLAQHLCWLSPHLCSIISFQCVRVTADVGRRHPSYSVTFKHLPPPHQSQLTHFVIHQPDGYNLFFLFFYINVFLQVKQKQHTYTCGEIPFVFPHVNLYCILMFDLGFNVFQVIANVAFLKCSSSFALSYIFIWHLRGPRVGFTTI